MAVNSEVPYVDVSTIRVRDLDIDELRAKSYSGAITNLGTTVTQTLTPSAILSGAITYSGATTTHTMPTAALIVAALPRPKVGERFTVVFQNTGGGTVTLAAVASGTTAATPLTIATTVQKTITLVLTNVTASSEAYQWFLQ